MGFVIRDELVVITLIVPLIICHRYISTFVCSLAKDVYVSSRVTHRGDRLHVRVILNLKGSSGRSFQDPLWLEISTLSLS